MGYFRKFTLIIFLFSLQSISAKDISNFKNTIGNPYIQKDTIVIDSCFDRAWSLRNSYPDSAILIAEKALEIAEKYKYKKGEANLTKCIAVIYWTKGDFYTSQTTFQRAIEKYEILSQSKHNYLSEIGQVGIASCYNGLGLISHSKGEYNKALEHYQYALEILEKTNDEKGIGSCLNNIGLVHQKQNNYNRAIEYYHEALDIYNKINDIKGIGTSYNNIAIINKKQGKLEEAKNNYLNALSIYQDVDNKKGISATYNNLAILYESQKDYKTALKYFEQSLDLKEKIREKNGISFVITNIAGLYNKMAKDESDINAANRYYINAINYLDKSFEIASEINSMQNQLNIYKNYYKSYKGLNNDTESLKYFILYSEMKDSIFSIEKNKQIEEMEALFQSEKKQHQIEQQLIEIKRQKQSKSYLFGLLVLVFIIAILIFIMYLLIRKKNYKISIQKDEIEKHRNHLEELVKERTFELQLAKDKAEESDRLKSSFLTNVSHEIRTPLNAILGFSSVLNNSDQTEESRNQLFQIINNNSDMLLRLIDDILDISKLETRQLVIKLKITNVHKILDKINLNLKKRRSLLEKEHIEIITNIKIDDNFEMLTDPLRLEQIMINLLDNALKFTEKGFIELGCFKDIDNTNITFYVKDTGIGLTPKQQTFIFERFNKIEEDNLTLYRGAGLGLTISKNLVELLNGRIWLESEKDKGSTFFVKFIY